jgi:hypothetical protein
MEYFAGRNFSKRNATFFRVGGSTNKDTIFIIFIQIESFKVCFSKRFKDMNKSIKDRFMEELWS